ncbi:hypothetical protein WSS15_21820 [Acetobacter pasteurianus]|uniref:YdaS family helix-turn-helix protein n=1 Tax=Acetobacter pasteurianus TaxID=438 RepID=UPI0022BE290D|nr:YdaS family helix-turn-helix protein [Acetobacter pasteurianus]GLH29532.1 hypothetical protein WSS15_21820 [Acetobacter pasteurianus]
MSEITGMALIRSRRGLSAKIAAKLGITRGAVAQWNVVPPQYCPIIEATFGIPREELRPDIFLKAESTGVAA